MASPIAASATSSVNTSGVLVTLIPFSRHFGKSILSSPTLKLATISNAGKVSIKLASAPILVIGVERMNPELEEIEALFKLFFEILFSIY
ncbi:hypothetical protein SDJN02_12303, partial [Cucurbita argyrosperma subsp. argyrosperma]